MAIADGVHVGQKDALLPRRARCHGRDRFIGVTCHNSRHLAIEAADAGADYVAFGAFFPTTPRRSTPAPRPIFFRWWSEMMVVPCVAIGGITPANAKPLIEAGADFLAVCAGVWASEARAAVIAFNR